MQRLHFLPPHTVSTSSMGGGRDDDAAPPLQRDGWRTGQPNQTDFQSFKKGQIKRYYSYSAKKMRNSSLIQKHSTKQKRKKYKDKKMHAINWGIQVKKKGLLMRKKGHLAKSKIYGNHEKKKAGILIPRNWLQPHSVTSVIALVGTGCEEH